MSGYDLNTFIAISKGPKRKFLEKLYAVVSFVIDTILLDFSSPLPVFQGLNLNQKI